MHCIFLENNTYPEYYIYYWNNFKQNALYSDHNGNYFLQLDILINAIQFHGGALLALLLSSES